MRPRVAVVVGNPKPESRTLAAARYVGRELTGVDPGQVVDLATLGTSLLDWRDPVVTELVTEVAASDLVVVASPTYKGTYTGLLKLFLDRFPSDGLLGVIGVPLMLGAGPGHAMAPETSLRPLLSELGASVPVRGLYVLDTEYDSSDAYRAWLDAARPLVSAFIDSRAGVE